MCGLYCLFCLAVACGGLGALVSGLPLHFGIGALLALFRSAVLALHVLSVLYLGFHGWQSCLAVGRLRCVENYNVRFALAVLLVQGGKPLAYLHPHHAVEPLQVVVIFLRCRSLFCCRVLRASATDEKRGNYQREHKKEFSPLLFGIYPRHGVNCLFLF